MKLSRGLEFLIKEIEIHKPIHKPIHEPVLKEPIKEHTARVFKHKGHQVRVQYLRARKGGKVETEEGQGGI